MFFKKKVYPILPTTESDTMTFIQKLDYLEYKLAQLNEKVVAAESAISDLETSVEGKSTVTATADGSTLQTLTVDGVTYNVPQGGGGDAGIYGIANIGLSMMTHASWKRVDDMFFFMIDFVDNADGFDDNTISLRLIDSNGGNYNGLNGGLDGRRFNTVISWLHTENGTSWPVWAEVQLEVFDDGLGNLNLPKGAHVLAGSAPLAGADVLADFKGLPLTFMVKDVL